MMISSLNTWIFCVLFVGVTPCLLNENAKSTKSLDINCADDSINMLTLNGSLVLSYDRMSCSIGPISSQGNCKPQCNLILHNMVCPTISPDDGDHSTNGLCPLVTDYQLPTECSKSRFACSQYDAIDLRHSLKICKESAVTVMNCSESCVKTSTYYSTSTGSCIKTKRISTQATSSTGRVILPLKYIQFGIDDNTENETDGVYVRTYTTSEEIFEALDSSLFDPYVILFREFNPCLNEIIQISGQTAFLYLPQLGTLFEFGNSSRSTKSETVTICTVAIDDGRLVISNILMATGFGLSIGGLLLTIVSVILTGEHRYIPGVNLICLSVSLVVAYLTVAIAKLIRGINEPCLPEGILHVVGLLASLAWMNVMAFDIWRTLSKMYPAVEDLTSSGRKMFLYCLYGWGLPITILVAGVLADHMSSVPQRLKPRFSISQCWFYMGVNTWGTVLFYYGPIGVIMFFNLLLFILTARILFHSHVLQRRLRDEQQMNKQIKYLFKLYVKLFLVMGLTWVLELTNLFLPQPELFIFSDFINTLQGFFIFIIFSCKLNVFNVLSYYCCPSSFSGLSKQDIQIFSKTFSNFQPSTSRKSSLETNFCQSVQTGVDRVK